MPKIFDQLKGFSVTFITDENLELSFLHNQQGFATDAFNLFLSMIKYNNNIK